MPKKKPRKDRTTSIKHEKRYYYLGCKRIMGIDEAGRGTWAGPVTAGAVCLPVEREGLKTYLKGVRDSKDMTPNQRLALVETRVAGQLDRRAGDDVSGLELLEAVLEEILEALFHVAELFVIIHQFGLVHLVERFLVFHH
jgi:ribonuclease HII